MSQDRAVNGGTPRNGPAADPSATGQVLPNGQSAVPGNPMIRRTVRVINPRGLHPRIIDLFTKTANKFESSITVWNGDLRADGKSVWDLIMLVVLPDTEVVLEVDGPDAAAAIESLSEILAAPGGEDYTI